MKKKIKEVKQRIDANIHKQMLQHPEILSQVKRPLYQKIKQRIIVWFDGLIIKRFMKVAHNYQKADKFVIKRFMKIAGNYKEALDLAVKITEQVHERSEYREQIKAMYKNIAEKELVLTTELKPIKKGADKYHVIVCKDTNLRTVFNINRHDSKGKITQMKPSYHERKL